MQALKQVSTGYFARAKEYAARGYALVSIARTAPWFLAKELNVYPCEMLNPTKEILAYKDKPELYEKLYKDFILRILSVERLIDYLKGIAHQEQKDKVVLMCYESPEKFCHRHLVAEWLNKEAGLEHPVEEVEIKNEKEQLELLPPPPPC